MSLMQEYEDKCLETERIWRIKQLVAAYQEYLSSLDHYEIKTIHCSASFELQARHLCRRLANVKI